MNRVIKFLMISDTLVLTSFGLIDPILAIFFKEDLIGGTILMAGLASTIFLMTKSLVQLPFSKFVDSHKYETRVKWLIFGTFLIATVPFIYIFAKHIYLVFLAQFIYGIGSGLAYPTWLGLWSTHLDKKKESFEWSLYSTISGLGTAITAGIGAALSQFLGFTFTFILVGTLSLTGCLILFQLDKKRNKMEKLFGIEYHKKRKLIFSRHKF
ncbi:MFS transporter [Candidatus Woesearchaeota archaeon]|nr:MFS transporter [Candidatus Woesearchaeota archaeon]